MAACEWLELCPFFTERSGYSPELQDEMKRDYCLGDNTRCARLWSFRYLKAEQIPDDLMPTETDRASELVRELAPGEDAG